MSGDPKPKPKYLKPRLENIPMFMRVLPCWVVWRAELQNGRWTKVPYIADKVLRKASSTDPQTWRTFEEACEVMDLFDGIGLMNDGAYVFLDWDGCLESNGTIADWARPSLEAFRGRGYLERSVSGTGIHGIARGSIPQGRREWKRGEHEGIAFYDRGRFLTVTGLVLEPRVHDLVVQTATITDVWRSIFQVSADETPEPGQAEQAPSLDDSELVQRAMSAKDGGKFGKLWRGEWQGTYPSQSEADAALLAKLAYWTDRDAARMDRLFRQSRLMREKWERDDYRDRTIAAALKLTTETWSGEPARREMPVSPNSAEANKSDRQENGELPPARGGRRRRDLMNIKVNNRELRDVTSDCIKALCAANHPPKLFVRAAELAVVAVDEDRRHVIRPASENRIRSELTRAANFYRLNVNRSQTTVAPPLDAVRDLMVRPCDEWDLPPIVGITESPFLRADGTIVRNPGYDRATRMVYTPPPGFDLPVIPDRPTSQDLRQAVDCIEDVIGDFPFQDAASRANTYAMFVSQVVRPIVNGSRPMALIDAPQAGSGKTLLTEILALIFTGSNAVLRPAPRDFRDEEWKKLITTILLGGHPLTVFDNLEGVLRSHSLAIAITAQTWGDRILGLSKDVVVPQNTNFIVTGNNIILGGDLPRRSYWIRLDPPSSRPWQGRKFKHGDLKSWVMSARPRIVAALLTMVKSWFVEGKPQPSTPMLGSFESWCHAVGGTLEHAGIPGFLGNLDNLYEQADPSQEQWTAFLAALYERYESPFTVAQVVSDAGGDLEFRRLFPDGLYNDREVEKKLGWAFRHRLGRRHGKENFRIVKTSTEGARVASWRVEADRLESEGN